MVGHQGGVGDQVGKMYFYLTLLHSCIKLKINLKKTYSKH